MPIARDQRKHPLGSWWTRLGARLIQSTRVLDKTYGICNEIRCELILALASDAVLTSYNDLAYGGSREYRPDSRSHKTLTPWERRAIDQFFPPPPARVLIGGAGGGREAFVLAERGYDIVAFEPSRPLAEAMAEEETEGVVDVYCSSYQDLPRLFPVQSGAPGASLDEMPYFEAGVFGWGSFSHLPSSQSRLKALEAFAQVVHGPLLVSFFARDPTPTNHTDHPASGAIPLRRRVPGRSKRGSGDVFSMGIGYHHLYNRAEILDLVCKAGLEVAALSIDTNSGDFPHAVLRPRSS